MKMKFKEVNIKNRRATFDYAISDTFTAGIVLTGTEIKSIRQGKASLVDTFCYVNNGEVWVKNMYIAEYFYGTYNNHTERRDRKLPAGKTIHLRTEPLHLDYPEDEKSVRSLTLRGVFRRDKVKVRLYASQHRETRRLIAAATGPYIRGLFGTRWRWFEVEIECPMREGDFFEAITFEFTNPMH